MAESEPEGSGGTEEALTPEPEQHEEKRSAKSSNSSAVVVAAAVATTEIYGQIIRAAAKTLATAIDGRPLIELVLPWGRAERKKSQEEKQSALVQELLAAGIDPLVFDALLTSELDRKLKVRFGFWFLTLTFLFSASSYAIVILNGIYSWGVSDIAITALVIETPIQFIGLLYIIARNLFPQPSNTPLQTDRATPGR